MGQEQLYYVYIMSNKRHTVLYIGVTNDLVRRIWEHKHGINKGFTKKYHLDQLVYYEANSSIILAITREKQLKSLSRHKKEALINSLNTKWNDLSQNWR